ncbi:MAG: hypothetical protein LBU53_06255 [Zoogloeaceae bacterium]|nr:hypothetical protein [Zoogloeaceae bacterium]
MPFPFFAGLVVGVVALRLYKNERLRAGIKDAGAKLSQGVRESGALAESRLRQAAVSSLGALSESSARLRERLEEAPPNPVAVAAATAAATPIKTAAAKSAKPAPKQSKPRASRKKIAGDA